MKEEDLQKSPMALWLPHVDDFQRRVGDKHFHKSFGSAISRKLPNISARACISEQAIYS